MSYIFNDDPTPALTTYIDAYGEVQLTNGSPQTDVISDEFGGTSVTPSVVPPSGWTLDSVDWSPSGPPFSIPSPGNEDSYSFDYQVSQGTTQKSNTGVFKIKKTSG